MKKSAKKSEKSVEEKSDRVVFDIPIPKRALGIKLPHGGCTLVATKTDAAKVPNYMRPLFDRILKAGKEGLKSSTLSRVEIWHTRTLLNEKNGPAFPFIKAIAVEKPKELSIAKAVKAKKAAAVKKAAVAEDKAAAKEAHKAHKKAA